jgi:hypothetical protein
LRAELFARAGANCTNTFVFHAPRCDNVVRAVFARLNGNNMS